MAKTKTSDRSYRDAEWLKKYADKGLWYGAIAKMVDISESTIVKHMIKNNVYTIVPEEIHSAALKNSIETGAICFFILMGNPVIKKNSQTNFNGMRLPNKRYAPFEEYHLAYFKKYFPAFIPNDPPYTLKFNFYRDSKRRVDISNLYEAPQDILVRAGIIPDDHCGIIASHHSDSRVKYDIEFPRTEIFFYNAKS